MHYLSNVVCIRILGCAYYTALKTRLGRSVDNVINASPPALYAGEEKADDNGWRTWPTDQQHRTSLFTASVYYPMDSVPVASA